MEKPSSARIALKWGVISAVITIIYSVVLFMTGQHLKNQALSYVSYVFLLGGMILAMKEYRSLNNDFMGFGEGLGLGTLLSAVSSLISSIFSFLYITFIDPTIMQQINDMQREQMESRGMTQEQVDQAMEMVSKFTSPGMIFIIGVLGAIFFGFILSLIVSAVMKKDKPEMNF
jgi:zinc transporter ZupT